MTPKRAILRAVLIAAVAASFFVHFSLHSLVVKLPFLGGDKVLMEHRNFWIASIAGWLILGLYWEALGQKAKDSKTAEATSSRGVHVFLITLAQLMVLVPIVGLGRLLPASPLIMSIGLVIEAAGLFLALWARTRLGANWSGRITVKVEHELIRSGPYRFLRHPIYTGLLAMYIGPALTNGERLGMIGVAIALVAYWRKIRLEEATLQSAFGADYESYRQSTWALVPGLY